MEEKDTNEIENANQEIPNPDIKGSEKENIDEDNQILSVGKAIQQEFSSLFMQQQEDSFDAFAKIMTPEHITELIRNSEKDSVREHKLLSREQQYNLIKWFLFIGLFVFLTIFLVNRSITAYYDVLKYIIVAAGGIGIGRGFFAKKEK